MASDSQATRDTRVMLLTRPQCHLCDAARAVVAQVCADVGVTWGETRVDSDPELRAEYSDQVPVVFVDDEVVATLRVAPDTLVAALAG